MSLASLQAQEHSETSAAQAKSYPAQNASTYNLQMFWRLRWFFAIALTSGYSASLLTGIVGFFLTKNPYFLTFLSPVALTPIVYYLVPMDERRYQLKLAKIQVKAQVQVAKQETKRQSMATKQNEKKPESSNW